jgi:hypothetical protein
MPPATTYRGSAGYLALERHRKSSGLVLLAGIWALGFYRRLRSSQLRPRRLQAVLLVPVIRVTGDVAKMLGYPAGWAWRLRNWGRAEIHWE